MVECQMSNGKKDPALENASASIVKAIVWTSHKQVNPGNLFPVSAVDLELLAFELYK